MVLMWWAVSVEEFVFQHCMSRLDLSSYWAPIAEMYSAPNQLHGFV